MSNLSRHEWRADSTGFGPNFWLFLPRIDENTSCSQPSQDLEAEVIVPLTDGTVPVLVWQGTRSLFPLAQVTRQVRLLNGTYSELYRHKNTPPCRDPDPRMGSHRYSLPSTVASSRDGPSTAGIGVLVGWGML